MTWIERDVREELVGVLHAIDEVAAILEVHRVQLHPELDPWSDGSPADRCARCQILVSRVIALANDLGELEARLEQ